jgi:hypothetical protein
MLGVLKVLGVLSFFRLLCVVDALPHLGFLVDVGALSRTGFLPPFD